MFAPSCVASCITVCFFGTEKLEKGISTGRSIEAPKTRKGPMKGKKDLSRVLHQAENYCQNSNTWNLFPEHPSFVCSHCFVSNWTSLIMSRIAVRTGNYHWNRIWPRITHQISICFFSFANFSFDSLAERGLIYGARYMPSLSCRPPPPDPKPHWLDPPDSIVCCHVTGWALGLYSDQAYLFNQFALLRLVMYNAMTAQRPASRIGRHGIARNDKKERCCWPHFRRKEEVLLLSGFHCSSCWSYFDSSRLAPGFLPRWPVWRLPLCVSRFFLLDAGFLISNEVETFSGVHKLQDPGWLIQFQTVKNTKLKSICTKGFFVILCNVIVSYISSFFFWISTGRDFDIVSGALALDNQC